MEYQSPGAALSEGLRSGIGLAANVQAIRQQREQQKWERDLKVAEMGMKLTENKNLPLDQRANAFNKGVRPVLARMGIQMPEMNATTLKSDSFQEAVKSSNGIIDQMQSGDLDPHVGFKAITQHFTGALSSMDAETEGQKTQRELIVNNANKYVDEADKAKAKSTEKTPTPADAIKRQTELDFQMANINKLGTPEQQIAVDALRKSGFNIQEGKIDEGQISALKNGVLREKSLLNEYIPDKYRSKTAITLDELKQLREKKPDYSLEDLHKDFYVTDAPDGHDPLKLAVGRKALIPMAPAGAAPMPAPGAGAPGAPVVAPRPVTPPPLATPAPMAAPAPVPLPTAGPLSLSGGAVQPSQAGPLQLRDQSLQ